MALQRNLLKTKKKKINKSKLITRSYACPEIYINDEIDCEKADIYSLGAILFKLVTHEDELLSSNDIKKKLYDLIQNNEENNGNYENYWEYLNQINDEADDDKKINLELSDNFKRLYVKMISIKPENRPPLDIILSDPWFEEVNVENKDEKDKLENEYREALSNIYDEIKEINEEFAITEKLKLDHITKALNSENRIFTLNNLEPKKILNDRMYFNLYIKINNFFPDSLVDFMDTLAQLIRDRLKADIEASEEILKFEVDFDKKEKLGKCVMDIELFEYEKGRYLLQFMRTGGEIVDYYHYFLKIKELIIKDLLTVKK